MLPRAKRVAELTQVNELRDLRFADDELRAALDLFVLIGKPERERVARIVRPLDDIDELFLEKIG